MSDMSGAGLAQLLQEIKLASANIKSTDDENRQHIRADRGIGQRSLPKARSLWCGDVNHIEPEFRKALSSFSFGNNGFLLAGNERTQRGQ